MTSLHLMLNAMYTILTVNEAFFESTDGPAGRGIMTRNDNSITRIHVYSRKGPTAPPYPHHDEWGLM